MYIYPNDVVDRVNEEKCIKENALFMLLEGRPFELLELVDIL